MAEIAFQLCDGEWPVNKMIKVKNTDGINANKQYMGAKESWGKLHVCSSDSLAEVVAACTSSIESYVIVETANPGKRFKVGGATLARGTCHYHLIQFCQK